MTSNRRLLILSCARRKCPHPGLRIALNRYDGPMFRILRKFLFPRLLDDSKNIGKNLRAYINGFWKNMLEIIDKFKLRATMDTLDEKGLLFC